MRRRCATIGTCCFGMRSGRPGLRSAPSRSRSREPSLISRLQGTPSRARSLCWAPAGRSSRAGSCSGAGARGTESARSWLPRARLVSRRVGQPRRRLGRRLHDRPGLFRICPPLVSLGDARLPRRPAGVLGGAGRRRACPRGRRARAGPAAGALLRPCDVRLRPVPEQSPARRRRARSLQRSQPVRRPSRPRLVASPDHGRRVERLRARAGRGSASSRRSSSPAASTSASSRRRSSRVSTAGSSGAASSSDGSGSPRRLLWRPSRPPSHGACFGTRRTRSSLARLVVELGESAPPGGLRDGLAEALADSELELAYPVGEGRYADARGRPVDAVVDGRSATPLVREGRPSR